MMVAQAHACLKRSPTVVSPSDAIATLRRFYGRIEPPPTRNAFELILFENVAYLAPAPRRLQAFELLKQSIGTAPPEILGATRASLERVAAHGILKARFADKLRECARIAVDLYAGDIGAELRGPIESARSALRKFPGIGAPGADKILLFCGRAACLAPESNGLRVLARLGFIDEDKSYARMYRASAAVEQQLPAKIPQMQQAHLLLHRHGISLCKRSSPRCRECPLANKCAYYGKAATQ
jgi:endonuclease III